MHHCLLTSPTTKLTVGWCLHEAEKQEIESKQVGTERVTSTPPVERIIGYKYLPARG